MHAFIGTCDKKYIYTVQLHLTASHLIAQDHKVVVIICCSSSDSPSSPGVGHLSPLPGPLPPGYGNLCLRQGLMSMFPHHSGLNFPPTTFPNTAPSVFSSPASVISGYPPHLPPFYLYTHAQKAYNSIV